MTNKLEIEIGDESDYQGSKVFASLAEAIGLSVDLVSVNLAAKECGSEISGKVHTHPPSNENDDKFILILREPINVVRECLC
jgi:hypothetical protein